MEREFIKNNKGVIIGEITGHGDKLEVWRREKLRYPARRRRILLGTCATIEDGRNMLLDESSAPCATSRRTRVGPVD